MTLRVFALTLMTATLCSGLLVSGSQAKEPATRIETIPAELSQAYRALDTAWKNAPLSFRAALFTNSPAKELGDYTPRASATFAPEDPFYVYVEPVGYSFRTKDGLFTYDLSVGYKLQNDSGQILAQQDQFASFSKSKRAPSRELMTALQFHIYGLPLGHYTLHIIYSDQISDQSASFDLPFEIAKAAEN